MGCKRSLHNLRPFILCAAAALLFGCADAGGRILEESQAALAAGAKPLALALALERLDADPNLIEAHNIVHATKDPVLAQRFERARDLYDSGRQDEAMYEMRSLITLARDISRRRFHAPVDEYLDELDRMKHERGGAVLKQADELYTQAKYAEALDKYIEANSLDPSPRIPEQIADCYYQLAEGSETGKTYRDAIRKYELANRFQPGYLDSRERIKSARFQLVQGYLARGRNRLACIECDRLAALDPNYLPEAGAAAQGKEMNAGQWARVVRSMATSRLAITLFKTRAGVHPVVEGRNIPALIQEKVHSKINARRSEFLILLREGTAQKALEAIKQSRMNEANPLTRKDAAFEVYDYWLEGSLNALNVVQPRPIVENLKGYITLTTWKKVYNLETQQEEWRVAGTIEHPYTYTKVRESIEVSLSGSARVNEVRGATTPVSDSISCMGDDSTEYVENLRMNAPPSNTRMTHSMAMRMIPGHIRELSKARRTLKSAGSIIDDLLETTSEIVSTWALKYLDKPVSIDEMPEPYKGL